jgi:hypothetical protein
MRRSVPKRANGAAKLQESLKMVLIISPPLKSGADFSSLS